MADRRILRLIQKWLKAGVSEDGQWSETNVGRDKAIGRGGGWTLGGNRPFTQSRSFNGGRQDQLTISVNVVLAVRLELELS